MPVPRNTPLLQELCNVLPGHLHRMVVRWRCQDRLASNRPPRSAEGGWEDEHPSNRAIKAEIRLARAAKRRERERVVIDDEESESDRLAA